MVNKANENDKLEDGKNGVAFNWDFGANVMFNSFIGAGVTFGVTKTVVDTIQNKEVGAFSFNFAVVLQGKLPY